MCSVLTDHSPLTLAQWRWTGQMTQGLTSDSEPPAAAGKWHGVPSPARTGRAALVSPCGAARPAARATGGQNSAPPSQRLAHRHLSPLPVVCRTLAGQQETACPSPSLVWRALDEQKETASPSLTPMWPTVTAAMPGLTVSSSSSPVLGSLALTRSSCCLTKS